MFIHHSSYWCVCVHVNTNVNDLLGEVVIFIIILIHMFGNVRLQAIKWHLIIKIILKIPSAIATTTIFHFNRRDDTKNSRSIKKIETQVFSKFMNSLRINNMYPEFICLPNALVRVYIQLNLLIKKLSSWRRRIECNILLSYSFLVFLTNSLFQRLMSEEDMGQNVHFIRCYSLIHTSYTHNLSLS